MSKTDSPQLDYAPAPPIYRRRRFRRVLFLLVFLACIYPASYWGPRAWNRGTMLYLQHRCLVHADPPDLIVYESKEAEAAKLLKDSRYVSLPIYLKTLAPVRIRSIAGYLPGELADLEKMAGTSGIGAYATIFLHGMRDKSGRERLVIVRRDSTNIGPISAPFNFNTTVLYPAGFGSDIAPAKTPAPALAYRGPIQFLRDYGLRFYAGQIDPTDPGHFTIRYELEGEEGVIDARLNDAADDVHYVILSGPAASPVSPWWVPGKSGGALTSK